MPGRQRLRRGLLAHAAAAAGCAAQLHLGGLGQCHRAGRAARPDQVAGLRPTRCSPRSTWRQATGGWPRRQPACGRSSRRRWPAARPAQQHARRLAGQITVTLQAALLARHAPAAVADAFAATRLSAAGPAPGPAGPAAPFGSLPGRAGPGRHPGPVGGRGPGTGSVRDCPDRVRSADANLAGRRLSAWCHLGRVGHQLRPVLRGRRAGPAVPVRRRRRRDPARADRGRRLRLALLPAGRRARPALRLPGRRSLRAAARAIAAIRPSCCSTRTARPSTAACAGTRRCSTTSSATRRCATTTTARRSCRATSSSTRTSTGPATGSRARPITRP